MSEPRHRPFTMADAMGLVAAITPGLLLLRIANGFGVFAAHASRTSPPGRDFVDELAVGGGCVLLSLTIGLLILAAIRRDRVEGPGLVACLGVLVALVLPLGYFAVGAMLPRDPTLSLVVPFVNMFARLVGVAGPLIVGAWMALALVGRWRILPTWTDRLGCFVGACWILIWFYGEIYFLAILPWLRWRQLTQ